MDLGGFHYFFYEEQVIYFKKFQLDLTGRHHLNDGDGYSLIMLCPQIKLTKIITIKPRDANSIEIAINILVESSDLQKVLFIVYYHCLLLKCFWTCPYVQLYLKIFIVSSGGW